MDTQAVRKRYLDAVLHTQKDEALSLVEHALTEGVPVEEIVFDVIVPIIRDMLDKYLDNQEISLSRHYIASSIADAAMRHGTYA